jgi:hypothetical protein
MNGYFLNDIFIRSPPTSTASMFFNNYLFKNVLNPPQTAYKINDNNVTLLYNDISYQFPTGQNQSLIQYYNARYTDLYSCCFNTLKLKVYLPNNGKFTLPNGLINPLPEDYNYQVYNIANPNVNCSGITENECIFFYRWYCAGLRSLVGYDKMDEYDSGCSCYKFNPANQVFIKLGNAVNCYDTSCVPSNTPTPDPVLITSVCQSTLCNNMLVISDLLASESIDISKLNLNLSCT